MHRAQERLSAWTFVQAIRANTESGLRACTLPDRALPNLCSSFGELTGRNHSPTLRLVSRGRWILDSYPKMARGKYEETIQFGWSTISEIFRSTTRLAST